MNAIYPDTLTVEVFKTSVANVADANMLVRLINARYDLVCVNFDLEDCDNILRVEGPEIDVEGILLLLIAGGFVGEVLQ